MNRRFVGVALAILAASSFSIGLILGTVDSMPVPAQGRSSPGRETPASPAPSIEVDPVGCEVRLRECREVARLEREGLIGRPDHWDSHPEGGYQPADVHSALQAVEEACPESSAADAQVDCEEYPCLVWLPDDLKASRSVFFCDAWPYRFGGAMHRIVQTSRGAMAVTVLPIRPADEPRTDDFIKRFEYRVDEHEHVALDAWREATEGDTADRALEGAGENDD